MKIRKLLASACTALLVGVGLSVATALPASAHTPTAWAECDAVYVEASNYETKPATQDQTEQKLVSEAVPYQPAVYGEKPVITPAVEYQPAVYETEYEFAHKKDPYKTKWSSNPNWNAENNENSLGWYATGNTRQGKLIKAEVLAQDAVYGEAPLISAEVPAKDAVYETVVTVPGSPANDYPNNVTITVDGVEVVNMPFGRNFETSWALDDSVAHDWTVVVTAWNDPTGSKGWTKTFSGTTTPCEQPPVTSPANPQAVLTAICGSADLTLKNPLIKDANQLTASFVVNIDGEFHKAYSVEAGNVVTDSFEFGEDTGIHTVEVFQAGTSEWKSIAKGDVPSDCIEPQPEDEVTTEQTVPVIPCDAEVGDEIATTTTVTTTPYVLEEGVWVPGTPVITTEDSTYVVTEADVEALEECPVVTPPTEEPPTTTPEKPEAPKPVTALSRTAPVDYELAETGANPVATLWTLTGGALLVALGALGVVLGLRRRQVTTED